MTSVATEAWVAELVECARRRIPFYRRHLEGLDGADLAALPTFDKRALAGFGRFPITAGGADGAYRVLATSGTTGDRLCVAFDRADWDRVATWLGMVGTEAVIGPGDALLNTHCYGLWVGGPALDLLAQRTGAALVPIGPDNPAVVLQFLADGIGTAISATPSYLRRLVETALSTGFDLKATGLRAGFIGAEPAEEPLRDRLREHLPEGFQWIELYGLTETGGPSVACAPDPAVAELALNLVDFRIEVLSTSADVPVGEGEVGELTITTRRPGCRTPLIRYRTRDLVRVAAGSPGEPMRLSRILGRADQSLKVCGVLIYPSSVSEIVTGLMSADSEWRAVVNRTGEEDELVIEAEAAPDDCRAVERAFDERIGLCVEVRSVERGALGRSHGKTQRILIGSTS
jgi:phenylacetate-CoA ligase